MSEIPRQTRRRIEITPEISRDNDADKYRKMIFMLRSLRRVAAAKRVVLTKLVSLQR